MSAVLAVQLALNGLTFGALLFLIASGFTLVFGAMRISNLAHGAFYVVGGYVAMVTIAGSGVFWVGVLAGAAAAAALGAVVELSLLRRLRGREMPEVLVTVGVLFVVTDVVLGVFGGEPRSVGIGSGAPSGTLTIGDFVYPWYRLFVVGLTVVVGVGLFVLQRRTRIGAIVRAGVDDRETTTAMGIDVDRVFTGVFVFGAFLAGAAGAVGSGVLGLSPSSGTEMLLYALVVVIIGGLGSIGGAAVGAVVIGLVDAFTKALAPELAYFTVFAPMAVVLMLRPRGLLGRAT